MISFSGEGVDREFRSLLKKTRSRCPECLALCEAEVWKLGGGEREKVVMKRVCEEHGEQSVVISSDARFYWLAMGSEENRDGSENERCGSACACSAGEGGMEGTLGRNADDPGAVEQLSTCLALIEIVDSCNLKCPTCFADSPEGTGDTLKYRSLAELKMRIKGVIERKGPIELLQLSGGEPTLHPEFFELLDWAYGEEGIDYVLINTNGVKIQGDREFREELSKRSQRGGLQLYLQYDGPQELGQMALRGADLRQMKKKVMDLCEEMKLSVTLAMTVTEENLAYLWETVQFGLKYECCRGVSFQPQFFSGRTAQEGGERLNTADVVMSLMEGSKKLLSERDFTPLPCGDPNCAVIGYLLRTPLGVRSVSDFIDFAKVQGFLKDKVRYELEDLMECGCDNTELGELLKRFEMKERDTFRLFVKPFMDAWSWDEDRIDRCCTHVIRPDGKLDSFCRYYLSGAKVGS